MYSGQLLTHLQRVRQVLYSPQEIDSYELDHLDFKTVAQYSYLDGHCFKLIYLYHSQSDHRAFFSLYIGATRKTSIFVVDRVRTNQMPNMTNLYQTERNSRLEQYANYPAPPEDVSFDVRVDTELRRAYRGIQRLLGEYKDARRGPTVILIQSPIGGPLLTQAIPTLEDFPSVLVPHLDSDGRYPVLDWQRVAAKRMVQQFLNTPSWLHNQLEQARYAHIPLGNLSKDPSLSITDVFFARHLLRHNHILWVSPSDKPDLGGREDDDYRLITDTEEGRSVELNSPGAYPTCCVELSLDGLSVNTVLQSQHINDYEGGSGSSISFDCTPQASLEELMEGGASTALSVYDEAALCSSSFKILRGMVHTWLHEVSTNQNIYADLQLQHFYRWIRTPSSLLYEPALCRMIHKLMKKLFMQLIGEFKRLGSSIVYADFNRIIVCTKKKRLEDASAYVEFILRSIQSRDLFHSIRIEPTANWEYLLWMDQANYGGVRVKLPPSLKALYSEEENSETATATQEEVGVASTPNEQEMGSLNEQEIEEPEVEMNWNVCNYLPESGSCQDIFRVMVAGHIHALYSHEVEGRRNHAPGSTPIQRRRANITQSQFTPDNTVTPSLVTFAQERIQKDITEKLFIFTQKIHQTLGGGDKGHHSSTVDLFPRLPGSHLTFANPALEFVKTLCKVLSLDSSTRHQVSKLRRDLLRLIGVREFSPEANFQDPCRSFVLPEVICESCNNCRDLDLCRDPFITHDESSNRMQWLCSYCHAPYNRDQIESNLIKAVQRRSDSFCLQDLVCVKCRGVKEANMSNYCSCAGGFALTVSRETLLEQMTTFRNIARHYGMELLDETVSWIIQMNQTDQL
jgi:DNA polymerase epsilon subunit 1